MAYAHDLNIHGLWKDGSICIMTQSCVRIRLEISTLLATPTAHAERKASLWWLCTCERIIQEIRRSSKRGVRLRVRVAHLGIVDLTLIGKMENWDFRATYFMEVILCPVRDSYGA